MPITVNGQTITDAELEREIQRLAQQRQGQTAPREQEPFLQHMQQKKLRREAEDHAIGRILLAMEAAHRFPEVPQEEIDRIYEEAYGKRPAGSQDEEQSRRRQIKGYIRVQMLLGTCTQAVEAPDDNQIFQHYMRHREEFTRPELVHASHIVKHLKEGEPDAAARLALESARDELRQGKAFAEVAASSSDCPDRGGDLGTFPRGQMVDEFDDVVFSLKDGECSEIFQTQFGLHIAMVHERIPPQEVPLEEVREQLRQHLMQERQTNAVEALIAELREKATIERG